MLLSTGARAQTRGLQTLLVIEPTPEHPRNSEGDVIELRDGTLLLAYTRFSGGTADNARADICARSSRDNGRTWSEDRLLVPNEGRENVMSVSLRRLQTGELLLFYLRKDGRSDCTMYVRRSTDGFATIGEPVRVTTTPGYHVVNNDRICERKDGRLLVPAALHPAKPGGWDEHGIPRAFLSDDGGRTWRADETVVDPVPSRGVVLQEPGILELRDGRLWMWMRTGSGSQYGCFSKDGGSSWSEPAPTALLSPRSPASVERTPWSGELLAVWNDHSGDRARLGERRTPLCAAVSRDDGLTWSDSVELESDPDGWYCYTSMTFVRDRVILSYCAGDQRVGKLNRLKVAAFHREWLEESARRGPRKEKAGGAARPPASLSSD